MTNTKIRTWRPEEATNRNVETVTVLKNTAEGATLIAADGGERFLPVTEMATSVRVGDSFFALYNNDGTVTTADPELLVLLLDGVSPEVREGKVRVMGVSRIPGERVKLVVAATEEGVYALPPIIGKGATRVRDLSEAIGGDRIDVVAWFEEPAESVRAAFSPAEPTQVEIQDGQVTVQVSGAQMHTALGEKGANVRLVSALYEVDIEIEPV